MSDRINCNGIEIRLESGCSGFTPTLKSRRGEDEGIFYVTLDVSSPIATALPDLKLVWNLPSVDFHHKWNPRCLQNRALDPGVGSFNTIDSSANSGSPVYSLYNLDGINACTWALSDVIHNTKMGGDYKSGKFYFSHVTVTGSSVGIVKDYQLTIRFDFRKIPYYQALDDVRRYWETLPGCQPCHVPEAARKPLFSSWYIYEVHIDPDDLERNCVLAKEIGFDTVILDDGWQTSQTTCGYQNNGDWEVCEAKIPDLKGHVKRVQDLGMKYMVWFSVPFVGTESKAYERFKDMLLPQGGLPNVHSIDMRFPEVRTYLMDKFVSFVNAYGVDGLKMDFICSCNDLVPARDILDDGRRDCVSIGEGMCKLLEATTTELRKINPDILIEFRHAYTGPAMRPYGNMMRAVDCPNSLGDNRVRTLDLRLLSGNTAVHADPMTWHDGEPDHSAAMQIIHTLFAVPQISRKIAALSESHRCMLHHQLNFVKEHEDVLQCGEIRPLYPHLLYPLVIARTENKLLVAFYSPMPVALEEELPDQLYLVNGSYASTVTLDIKRDYGVASMKVVDCLGQVIDKTEVEISKGLNQLNVPPAGHIQLEYSRQIAKTSW